MGRLILCYEKKAEKPYYVKTMNLHLYTLEELCYFLYDNLYWLDETVVNDELSDWIVTQLELKDLEQSLATNRGNLQQYVLLILNYAGYNSGEDMVDANNRLLERNEQSEFEKSLGRALHFLQCKLYMEAIMEYKKLLDGNEENQLDKIYNNMGNAYAGLFVFKEAAKCFHQAYQISKDETIFHNMIYAAAMANKEEIDEFIGELPSDYKQVYQRELERVRKEWDNKKLNQLNEVLLHKSSKQIAQYYKGLENLLNDWKKEYIHYTQ